MATTIDGRRFYPIGVAEKGYAVYRLTVHGAWGHGSMPREDNAAILASRIVTTFAEQGPPRLTATMERFLADVSANVGEDGRRLIAALSGPGSEAGGGRPQGRVRPDLRAQVLAA